MEKEVVIRTPTLKEQRYFPLRYFVALLAFFGMSFNYMLRININLAIVAMVLPSNDSDSTDNDNNECGYLDANATATDDYNGEFDWDVFTQSLILGAFFWGYIWTQIPGGRLAEKVGASAVFGGAILTSAVVTVLIPLMAHWSYKALIVFRVFLGVSQGATFPSTHAFLSCWAPPHERSMLSAMVYAGSQAGTVIGYLLTAAILDWYSWEAVFIIEGLLTMGWALLWFVTVSNSPTKSKWITQVEKDYIINSIGESKKKKSPPVPWKKVFTSIPFWAILIAGIGNNWGFYTLLTDLPLYMKEILKKDINANAMLSSMPYLCMLVFSLIVSAIGDAIRRNNILSTVVVRKVANSIAHLGPAICLLSLFFVECDREATVLLLFLAVTLQGGIYTGFMVNHIDIAPNFAGTLFGITNAAATIPGWLAPMTVGALTNNKQTIGQWRIVFFIAAAFYVADAVFFIVFASGVEQSWNRLGSDGNEDKETDADQVDTISSMVDGGRRKVSSQDDVPTKSKQAQVKKRPTAGENDKDPVYSDYILNINQRGAYQNKAFQPDGK